MEVTYISPLAEEYFHNTSTRPNLLLCNSLLETTPHPHGPQTLHHTVISGLYHVIQYGGQMQTHEHVRNSSNDDGLVQFPR